MNKRTLIVFTGVILLLVLVAAATGIFYQMAGTHSNFVTVRGEHATFQGYGLYYYDPASVAREGIIWDVIDLCLALSAVAFFLNLGGIKVSSLPKHISTHFPRWLFITFTLVMSTALIVLWLGRIIPYTLAGRFPDELAGLTTLVTQAFDLGIVVPLLLATAVLLWRHFFWSIQEKEIVHSPYEKEMVSVP